MNLYYKSLVLALYLTLIAIGSHGVATAQDTHAISIDISGDINPITARYLKQSLKVAESNGAHIMIVILDTPGGLFSSTRDMVSSLLESEIPTVVYVSPMGSQAASGGTFVAASANFAAMAPGTNIGAASPVARDGTDLPETLKNKATEDASALIRGIAMERGRDSESLEATILAGKSYSSQEAKNIGIVDFIAADMEELLLKLDGSIAYTTHGRQVVMKTSEIKIKELPIGMLNRFLIFLSDPNVSFILLALGTLGILIELLTPGVLVPGVLGGTCILLAFTGFTNLPVNWLGVGLILLSFMLLFLETQVTSYGILGAVSLLLFVFGGLIMFDQSPTSPGMRLDLRILISAALMLAALAIWALSIMINSTRGTAIPKVKTLVGKVGVVTTQIAPIGTIRVTGEFWRAISDTHGSINQGEKVLVLSMDEELTARVSRTNQ